MLVSLYLFSLNQKKQNPEKTLYRALENFIEFETHHESLKIDTSPSANIVHETMILNNHGIGRYMMENNIPYTSTTNIEAAKRIETLYLRDCGIPLYPEEISNKLCSLLPNNNRNVITCIYHLDSKLNLIDPVPTIVKG